MTGDARSGFFAALALVFGSPLALWMGAQGAVPAAGGGAPQADRPAQQAEAGSAGAHAATPAEDPSPSEYCVGRMLSPLFALAAQPELASKREPASSDGSADWLARVDRAADALRDALRAEHAPLRIQTMIATLPDPIDSGLVYHFETSLQALRAGFERRLATGADPAAGLLAGAYFRDRGFLPWDDREMDAAGRARSEACRTALPGLLLFRNSDLASPAVMVVLVVGETPTTGLRGAALLNALRVATRLDARAGIDRAIQVLGPTFSGSAYSLRMVLAKFARERPSARGFAIISGTASGADVPSLLRSASSPLGAAPAPPMTYATTTIPQAASDCAYLHFLRGRLGVPARPAAGQDARTLEGVATLHESGTEFGSTGGDGCDLRAELRLSFPVHVSFLRDAYEDMDQRDDARQRDAPIARSTSLGAALREPRVPLEVGADPSPKARAAMDVMLSAVLGEVSRRAVRHVSIHATDIGDAIFLARKIRDVAPDVRIAFFDPDDILLHPQFRSDLLGSLVVSAYPFLGVSDFRLGSARDHPYMGFTNAGAQGLFNAVLAQRGVPAPELFEYAFEPGRGQPDSTDASPPLLVWVSAIARTGLVPIQVKPPVDCTRAIYGMSGPNAALDEMCREPRSAGAWQHYDQVSGASLPIDPALELPRFWNFLYASLLFGFLVDRARQNRTARGLSRDRMPACFECGDDLSADRAIGRTKWWLYSAIRSFLFVLAFAYMGTVYLLVFIARDGYHASVGELLWAAPIAFCELCALGGAGWFCVKAMQRFVDDYSAFAGYVGESVFPLSLEAIKAGFRSGRISSSGVSGTAVTQSLRPRTRAERLTLSLGLAPPVDRVTAAKVSFAQLRMVATLTFALVCAFTWCLCANSLVAADFAHSSLREAVPTLTLNVLRNVPLLNGVSPAAPALLCIACVYVWSVGRMARLALAHGISRIAPPDGETDLVSTPIRCVLYPHHSAAAPNDEGYTRAERDLLNSIWRPITGRYYVFACGVVIFFPILLFTLKPLSTLEGLWGSWLLGGALGLSAVLNGVTLVQMIQYWVRFQRLLKRTMAHQLGPAFARLPDFARDSIDRQISGSADDLLRWSACARQFRTLVAAMGDADAHGTLERLRDHACRLESSAQTALVMADAPDAKGNESHTLAEGVIAAAADVSRLLMARGPSVRAREPELQRVDQYVVNHVVQQLAVGDDVRVGPQLGLDSPMASAAHETAPQPPSGEHPAMHVASPIAPGDSGFAPTRVPHAAGAGGSHASSSDAVSPGWTADAEVLVVTVATLLIHRHVRQFRYFMSTLVATALLLLLAMTSYPFEPYRLLLTCIWAVVGSVVGAGAWIYLQLDRNTLISHISGTPPNHLTFNSGLVLRVVTWVIIPLLSVAAAQYPRIADLFFQLIAPFARTLK